MAVLQPNRELIAPPPTQRVRYGLFTAGSVVPMSDRMLGNGLQFYADHCGEFTELYNQECLSLIHI